MAWVTSMLLTVRSSPSVGPRCLGGAAAPLPLKRDSGPGRFGLFSTTPKLLAIPPTVLSAANSLVSARPTPVERESTARCRPQGDIDDKSGTTASDHSLPIVATD